MKILSAVPVSRKPSCGHDDCHGYLCSISNASFSAPAAPVSALAGSVSSGLRSGPLGSVTKTYSPALSGVQFDPETGEVFGDANGPKGAASESDAKRLTRANRYARHAVMRSILPDSRYSACHVFRAPIAGKGLSPLEVMRSESSKSAFYQGLMTCGSVWVCPLCAAKIANRRRVELGAAADAAHALGWSTHFVTLTVPHGLGTDLQQMLDSMQGATKRLSQGKHAVSVAFGGDLHGFIRVLEVTHGANGWHPHYHLLVFTSPRLTCEDVLSIYLPRWKRACRLAGLPVPSDEHGVTVQDGSNASNYISKWGAADEMTKGHLKKSRSDSGLSPFALLDVRAGALELPDYSPARAGVLFIEYTNCFHGRRQLYWSNGLRSKLSLSKEISDEELCELSDDKAKALAEITVPQWRAIRRHKLQSAVLDLAEHTPLALSSFLSELGAIGDKLPVDSERPVIARASVALSLLLPGSSVSHLVDVSDLGSIPLSRGSLEPVDYSVRSSPSGGGS